MGILCGILALLSALLGVFLGGIIGFGITVFFAVLAIIFAIRKKKVIERVAVGPIIMSVISLIVGGLILIGLFSVISTYKDEMKKYPGEYPVCEAYMDDLKFGVVGMAAKMSSDDVNLDEFTDELDKLRKVSE